MNNDSRVLAYISLMALIFSCVVMGYSLVFFGFGLQGTVHGPSIPTSIIIAIGLILAAVNGIASNILSSQLEKGITTLKPALKLGIPLMIFLMTLAISIFIALISA